MTAGVSLAPIAAALAPACQELAGYLATWAARDDSKADVQAVEAGNAAIDAIDAVIAELHAIRSRLVTEYQASRDQAAARVDELLAQRQNGGAL